MSTTTLLGQYHNAFDKKYWLKKKSEELGISEKRLEQQWDQIKDEACERGTRTHNGLEDGINESSMFKKAIQYMYRPSDGDMITLADLPNINMNVKEMTQMLQTGIMHDPNQLSITYIEGKNIRWLAKKIEETTNNSQEDVMKVLEDENYINSLIEKYWFLTDEIKQEEIYYPLEGYLFPDTYSIKNKDVSVEEIFEKMLDKMERVLDEYKDEIEKNKYSVHEILTIASIIETESMNSEGRKDVASVIYNRLDRGMAIQSDVTTYYAVKVDMGERDLYQKELDTYNAYNTRGPNMEGKLPIGPVASVSKSSIEAALEPNKTDYIFFVADKNGKLYFTKTSSEHNRIISELKENGLWFEY